MINDIKEITPEEFFKKKTQTISKQEIDIFEISNQIKRVMDTAIKSLKDCGLNNEHEENDDKELADYLKDLNTQSERIGGKFVKGLGQMYKGVLVSGEISVRENGGVYRYRCQWKLDCNQVAEHLLKQEQNVMQNMGEQKGTIVFEILKKLYKDNQRVLDVDTSMAEGEQDVKPFNVYDFQEKNYHNEELDYRGRILKICKLKFNRGKITFEDGDGKDIDNNIIHKLCLARHKDVIAAIRTDVVNQLQAKKNEFDEIEKFVDDKMGKWLLVAEF